MTAFWEDIEESAVDISDLAGAPATINGHLVTFLPGGVSVTGRASGPMIEDQWQNGVNQERRQIKISPADYELIGSPISGARIQFDDTNWELDAVVPTRAKVFLNLVRYTS